MPVPEHRSATQKRRGRSANAGFKPTAWRSTGASILALSIQTDYILPGGLAAAKLLAAAGLLALLTTRTNGPTTPKSPTLLMLFAGSSIIGTIFVGSNHLGDAARSVISSLTIGVAFAALIMRVEGPLLMHLLRSFTLWTSVASALGIAQALTGRLFVGDRAFISELLPGLYRASGLTDDPNYFGLLCIMAAPIAVYESLHGRPAAKTKLILIVTATVLTGSRSTVLVAVATALVGRLALKKSIAETVLYLAMTGLVLVPAGALLAKRLPASLRKVFDAENYYETSERNSLQDRFYAAKLAFEVGRNTPVLGCGVGQFRTHPLNHHEQVSHNNYLELFAETGTLGLTIYLMALGLMLRDLRRISTSQTASEKRIATALFFSLLGFAMMSCTLVTYYSRIWFFASGLAGCYINRMNTRVAHRNGQSLPLGVGDKTSPFRLSQAG